MKPLLLSLAVFALTIPVHADPLDSGLLYTYTGNPFTTFTNGASCPPDCKITGWFSVLTSIANLGDNFNGPFVPLDFSFTDGNVTFTKSELPDTFFGAQTDSTGKLIKWSISLQNGFTVGSVALVTATYSPVVDAYNEFLGQPNPYLPPVYAQAYNFNDPGTWTLQSFTTTPEPGTGWLMLLLVPMLMLVKTRVARSR
jgi:hypothetical protein